MHKRGCASSGGSGGDGSANEAPVFDATASVTENTETVVYTPTVTDADGNPLTFTLSGTDAALFNINEQTGAVTFIDAPDYEAPRDDDGDNAYNIVITASDGTNSTDQDVTVTVTNENEPASVLDLSDISTTEGVIIQGDAAGDRTGWSVSSAGDVNGDGFEDLIVGARLGDGGGSNAGEAYVIYGGATGTESTLTVTQTGTDGVADNFTGNAVKDIFTGIGADDVVRVMTVSR